MQDLALGLIETRGLIAALEAADAALKAADVKLVSRDRIDAGLITIKLVGEIAAVQSAVDAGAAAAQRVGHLVGKHVIARPDTGLHDILIYTEIDSRKKPKAGADKAAAEKVSTDKADENGDGTNDAVTITFERDALQPMTVEELRRIARKIEHFPLQGREISRANKEELIDAITQAAPKA